MCPPSDDSSSHTAASAAAPEFSLEERIVLLRLAHESIAAALEQRELPLIPPMAHLAEPRGAFTTLYYRGGFARLCGFCVSYGFALPHHRRKRAWRGIRRLEISAGDARRGRPAGSLAQRPVPPEPIAAEEIEIGRHGLLITHGVHRGLLLPQVAVEHGWDRITFLEQTCRKAGLPLNAWQTGAQLEAFTTEAFGDRDVKP